ncbi:MAG: phosphoenolpyruvate--protein phosphotransferase [Pirellulaceae bacterium]
MRKGIAVSPGISVGTAYCINEIFVKPERKRLQDSEVSEELARYEAARDKVTIELHALQTKVEQQVGKDEAAIFATHQAILRDAAFTNKIRKWIVDDRCSAPAALQRLLEEYTVLFSKANDSFLRERLADVRDVVVRISSHLSDMLHSDMPPIEGNLILVADELLPSQAVNLGNIDVSGIITQRGSQTSHAAIIARSRGVPAISGVRGILKQIRTGDTVVVDGTAGVVEINPDAEVLSAYLKLQREFTDLRGALAENRDQPAITADQVPLSIMANINSVRDAQTASSMGAVGVGLYRTEYLYLTHASVPDEDEQFQTYVEVIQASPGQTVTIRTLDIGGDKTIPYLGHMQQEANPFMGWRSIRLSFEHPEFFNTQIRAILRAAGACPDADVKVMFPMITTLEEMRRVRLMVRKAAAQLEKRGATYRRVPLGMMLEVPAAAVCIDTIMSEADFVSIGSNDLVQYLMAADRDNPKVSHLCQPLSPAVISVLAQVIAKCNRAKKPVTLCGEMAGQPRAFVLLLGMGLRYFSTSPAFIPVLKKLASSITVKDAERVLRRVQELKTTNQVKRYMKQQLQELAPGFNVMETV